MNANAITKYTWISYTAIRSNLAYLGNEDTMRLACMTEVNGDMTVVTKPALNIFGENFFS